MPHGSPMERAKRILSSGTCTCAACKGGIVYIGQDRGIGQLVAWIDGADDLRGASVADRVIGKASAFLYVILGIREAYAPVASEPAIEVLRRAGIAIDCGTAVPRIANRALSGPCPFEEAVMAIDDPDEALKAIRKRLSELSRLPITKQV